MMNRNWLAHQMHQQSFSSPYDNQSAAEFMLKFIKSRFCVFCREYDTMHWTFIQFPVLIYLNSHHEGASVLYTVFLPLTNTQGLLINTFRIFASQDSIGFILHRNISNSMMSNQLLVLFLMS